ncbi:MAG: glycogen debranching protein GlgX [Candidatus Omnitrophica bacterium]|nr:glycogen debranching protein GlgX [Candidatus Omnitrophota bacterium]
MSTSAPTLETGRATPLGATFDGSGTNFAIFAKHATSVELCLFDSPEAARETHRLPLQERTQGVWHAYLPAIGPGQLYGYRIHGPYTPRQGHRFNPFKVLLDPYAKALGRPLKWSDELFSYRFTKRRSDLFMDRKDSAACAPLGMVVEEHYDWGEDKAPLVPWDKTLIYETHVKGMTALHPKVPRELRGTYAGLASEPVIRHLQELGITAIELLPVHLHADDRHLEDKGTTNYWGYNTLSFFIPHYEYAAAQDPVLAIHEFRNMVKSFHNAGIEVILDVVYNHTAEGNQFGPTLNFRGIDNASYYRLEPNNPRFYQNFSGCGNTLNLRHPQVRQLVLDSLRYWVGEMHVDGFRFDLATALARGKDSVEMNGAFFREINEDPLLNKTKLIAEPWDLGFDGYQLGNFPPPWTEWNDKFRSAVRNYWKSTPGTLPDFISRVCGSGWEFDTKGRPPSASINFVTCHDGFTLQDLVSYNSKHNEANGENNRDGESHNLSWNCGVEGPTDDPETVSRRQKHKRNFMATLMISIGTPMILGGDELGHTQLGNNNAYCQDSELSWLNWDLSPTDQEFLEFTKHVIRLRRTEPLLGRTEYLTGRFLPGLRAKDVLWLKPSGQEMKQSDWQSPNLLCIGMWLVGADSTFFILMNAGHSEQVFYPPCYRAPHSWTTMIHTSVPERHGEQIPCGTPYTLPPRTLAALKLS